MDADASRRRPGPGACARDGAARGSRIDAGAHAGVAACPGYRSHPQTDGKLTRILRCGVSNVRSVPRPTPSLRTRRELPMCFPLRSAADVWAAALVVAACGISAQAQSQSADERAIRDLIARYDVGESVPHTNDMIYWTGEFKRPMVGSQNPEPLPPDEQPSLARVSGAPSERAPRSRRRVT